MATQKEQTDRSPEVAPALSLDPEQASSNFYWILEREGQAFNLQTTVRGIVGPEELQAHFRSAVHALDMVVKAGGKAKQVGQQASPPAAQPPKLPLDQKIALEEGNKQMAAELKQAAEEVPPPPAGKTWLTLDAKIVKVLPQPDNKVTIEFYSDGHKYPDVKVVKWKLEAAAGLLKHITAEPADKAGEYSLPCRVYYTEGKEYTTPSGTTGHYKDVAHVRPL